MSGGKHTPGPWTACKGGECSCGQVFAGGDKHVATVHAATQDSDGTTYAEWPAEERLANVHLIAAAPDLLEALEELVVTADSMRAWIERQSAATPEDHAVIARARTAIAKAKGERS